MSPEAIEEMAELLELTPAEVLGVCSFYTMFKREPVGDLVVSVCTNVTCLVTGGPEVLARPRLALPRRRRGARRGGRVPRGLRRRPGAAGELRVPRAPHARVRRLVGRGLSKRDERRRARSPGRGSPPATGVGRRRGARDPHRHEAPARPPRRLVDDRAATCRPGRYEALRTALAMTPEADRPGAGEGVGPARPRRRRLRHRPEVVVPPQGRVPALPRRERRRGRAVDVQGPHAPRAATRTSSSRASPSPRSRSSATRRSSTSAASSRSATSASSRRSPRPTKGLPRQEHPRLGLRPRDRGAPRRRRLHLRRGDGAAREPRGRAGDAADQAAVPRGRRASTPSRRS